LPCELNCLKLLDDVTFIQFNNKKLSHYLHQKIKNDRLLQQRTTTEQNAVFALCDGLMVTDDVLKLGYISGLIVDLRVKVDGIYYCDLLLSQQLLPECIF